MRLTTPRPWGGRRGNAAYAASAEYDRGVGLVGCLRVAGAGAGVAAALATSSNGIVRAAHVEVDVGAVAGDDVAQVLLVSERQVVATILWNWVQAARPVRRLCDLASAR